MASAQSGCESPTLFLAIPPQLRVGMLKVSPSSKVRFLEASTSHGTQRERCGWLLPSGHLTSRLKRGQAKASGQRDSGVAAQSSPRVLRTACC